MLPKANASAKSYAGQTKWIYFSIENNYLLKKYNTIWDKASAYIKKESGSESVYKKTLKTKIKFCTNESADLPDKEIPKVDSTLICLVAISLDSALNEDGNYCPQVVLKECKYIKKVMIRNILGNIKIFSDDSDESDAE